MKSKLIILAVASILELFALGSSAQAQVYVGVGGRGWGVGVGVPVYGRYYYGPRYVYSNYPYYYYAPYPYYYGGAVTVAPGYGYVPGSTVIYQTPVAPSTVTTTPGTTVTPPVAGATGSSASGTGSSSTMPPALPPTNPKAAIGQPKAAPAAPSTDRAHVRITVPVATAQVWVNNRLLEQQGNERSFMSPVLQPGTYNYRIKASWEENGKPVNQEQQVQVSPGQSITVGFGAQPQ